MWATPFEKLLLNLKGDMPESLPDYLPKDQAYEGLKKLSGEDYGYDIARWETWGRTNAQTLGPGAIKTGEKAGRRK
jgi:hypothetical protein